MPSRSTALLELGLAVREADERRVSDCRRVTRSPATPRAIPARPLRRYRLGHWNDRSSSRVGLILRDRSPGKMLDFETNAIGLATNAIDLSEMNESACSALRLSVSLRTMAYTVAPVGTRCKGVWAGARSD